MWWANRSAQKKQKNKQKEEEEEETKEETKEEKTKEEEEEENEKQLKELQEIKELEEEEEDQITTEQNLIYPDLKFLKNLIETPIPSFPQSEINLEQNHCNLTPTNHHKTNHQQPKSTIPTVRFVETQSSNINLPYPNPDLSFTSNHETPTTSNPKQSNEGRRISGLPSRARTSLFKPIPSPLRYSPTNNDQPLYPTLNQLISSPSENKENSNPSTSEKPIENSQPEPKPEVQKTIFPTPSAAISSVIRTSNKLNLVPNSIIDQVLNELESRSKTAPSLISKVTFQDQKDLQSDQINQTTNDRFERAHGKQFEKYDSISHHYAAKRKNNQSTTTEETKPSQNINQPNKRAKVSDLGYPKRVVSQQEIDSNHAEKKNEIIKRQLELARARRKSGAGNSRLPQKAGSMKPRPSGFSSFGTRLIKSAMKTVSGVIKSTAQQLSTTSKTITKNTDGVGFGVPAGLGVGPAKVPPSPIKRSLSQRQQPTKTIVKPALNRLPPAGLNRVIRPTRSTSSTLNGVNTRTVIPAPPKTRSQTIDSAASTTVSEETHSKPSWKPQTIPKRMSVRARAKGVGTEAATNPTTTLTRKRKNEMEKNPTDEKSTNATRTMMMTTKSSTRLPQKIFLSQTQGQTIIRPTVQIKKIHPDSSSSTHNNYQKFMKTSTSTIASTVHSKSKDSHGLISKDSKKLPTKLDQPTHPTKAIPTKIQPRLFKSIPNKNNVRISSLNKNKSKPTPNISSKQSLNLASKSTSNSKIVTAKKINGKIVVPSLTSININNNINKKRRKSSLNVGTKAVSHRISCRNSSFIPVNHNFKTSPAAAAV